MEVPKDTIITVDSQGTESPREVSLNQAKGKSNSLRNEFVRRMTIEYFIDAHGTASSSEHDLGRDDAVWPCYVKEAEEWDDLLMQKWNDSMDVILLFATLFSAIVTAFVIESSKNLQEDTAAVTASVITEIAATLRAIAEGASGNQSLPTPSTTRENFKPSAGAVLVNMAWFISLSLSIVVALVAILVKQWCLSFTSDRTAPPCNQARIRQARFNKLKAWKTEVIISVLPIIMHAALGLFLLGLIIFLRELHDLIYVAIAIVGAVTLAFYVGTTLMPLRYPFCPYETPLSSPKLWGYLWWLFNRFSDKTNNDYMSPCVRQETETSNNTAPDEITGHALNWLIMHSRNPQSQKMAIQAIAGANSDTTLQELLAIQPGIFPQVVQSFTSNFNNKGFDIDGLKTASMHGQALSVLASRAVSEQSTQADQLMKWGIDLSTMIDVEHGFRLLAGSNDLKVATFGLMGLSSWHDFTMSSGEARFLNGETISQLTRTLKDESLPDSLATGVLRTLVVESTFWVPNIDTERRQTILHNLVTLIDVTQAQSRPMIACTLAVLGLAITHHYRDTKPGASTDAQEVSRFYLQNPDECNRDVDALMLLGLARLMDHYEHCILDDDNLQDMKIIANELGRLSILGKARLISLDNRIKYSVDIRSYLVDVLILHFQRPRVSRRDNDYDQLSAALLKSINDKPFIWIHHGSQFGLPIIQMLAHADHDELQEQCLIAISNHGYLMGPPVSYMAMLLSYNIPNKLARLIRDKQPSASTLIPFVTTIFEHIAERLSGDAMLEEHGLGALNQIIEGGLFGIVFRRILYHPESKSRHIGHWRRAAITYLERNGLEMSYEDRYPIYAYLLETIQRGERQEGLFSHMLRDIADNSPPPNIQIDRRTFRTWRAWVAQKKSTKGSISAASSPCVNRSVMGVVPTADPQTGGNSSSVRVQFDNLNTEPSAV